MRSALLRAVCISFLIVAGPAVAEENRNLAVAPAQAGRVALVIGNAAYPGVAVLKNPANDANDIAAKLRKLNFDVTLKLNVGLKEMLRAFTTFGNKIRPGSEVVVFYAGHGMQVRGKNYLIPIDAEIGNETAVSSESVDVDQLLDKLATARLSMVILDACRNNPFERKFRGGGQGLASINAPTGTLIAYATAPGKVASDGDGKNGLYTQELLAAMDVPGMKVEDVFKRVRANVVKRTGDAQTPWESSSLTGDFYFVPRSESDPEPQRIAQLVPSVTSARTPQQIEDELWDAIKNSPTPSVFDEYLRGYPKGRYATQAKVRLAEMAEAKRRQQPAAPNAGGGNSSRPVSGGAQNDEARRHLLRGIAAIELAKSDYDLSDALQEFRKAVEIAPAFAAAWVNIGVLEAKLRHFENAMAAYRQYLTLNPAGEDADKVRKDIAKLEYQQERAEASSKPGWMLVGTDVNNGTNRSYYIDRSKIRKTTEGIAVSVLFDYQQGFQWGPSIVTSYFAEWIFDCAGNRSKFMGAIHYSEHMGNGVIVNEVSPAKSHPASGIGKTWIHVSASGNEQALPPIFAAACRDR